MTYTEEDLKLMTTRLYEACAAAMAIDAGVLSTPKALLAALKKINSELDARQNAPLIGALRTHVQNTDPPGDLPPADDRERLFADLGALVRMLQTKASAEEVAAYRDVLVGGVRAAVEASGGGVFGLGSDVNQEERAFLDRIERTFEN